MSIGSLSGNICRYLRKPWSRCPRILSDNHSLNMIKLSKVALMLLALTTATQSVCSDDELAVPKSELESTIRELLEVMHADNNQLPYEAKREEIFSILNRQFSFDVIIQRALGRNWKQLDEKQQNQVSSLVTDLVLQAYTRELQNGPKPVLTFDEPEVLSSSKIEIDSTATVDGKKVNLSYRLANIRGRGWQVYDVLVEGVSMVSNYRKQFDEHFQTKDASDLINLLKDKLNKA